LAENPAPAGASTVRRPNRLVREKSPYLLQHAYNPVDWYSWGPEAFEKARREDKPIFLSIGYSTCHWCHVMEHESFEDEETARILNENFVPIKVDREERPDLDNVYMNAVMAMTGSGGWPLSIFLTHDGKPFLGGTYFPPEDRFGRPGFKRLLLQVARLWKERRQDLLRQGEQLTQLVRQTLSSTHPGGLYEEVLDNAFRALDLSFDEVNGGFGSAPKFPIPHNLSFLLRYCERAGEERAVEMVVKTLDAMARGGIHDQLGGGFHRYSTDDEWLVPHFEKMLYDQALLARAYLEAYQVTGHARLADAARDIFGYVLRDLRDPGGAFYSAEDADSEGYEGKFYLWTPAELKAVLGEEVGAIVCRFYDVREGGNFPTHGGHFEQGKSILRIRVPLGEFAHKEGRDARELGEIIRDARRRLFMARERRVRPHRDDKILADWNGLMISSLALGARVLGDRVYAEAAERAATFIIEKMRAEGRLLRRYRDGEAAIQGYLSDYAFFCWGLLELYQATFRTRWLREAKWLSEDMIRRFWDEDRGAFRFAGEGNERLIADVLEVHDGAIPSGNSIAALVLLLLSEMTGNAGLEARAERIFRTFGLQVSQQPTAYSQLLIAYDFALGPRKEIVVAGDVQAEATKDIINGVNRKFLPRCVVVLRPPDEAGREIDELAPFVRQQTPVDGKPAAYVCEDFSCKRPVTSLEELTKQL